MRSVGAKALFIFIDADNLFTTLFVCLLVVFSLDTSDTGFLKYSFVKANQWRTL